jgi:hypothetical protein
MATPTEYTFWGYWGAMAMKIFILFFHTWRAVVTIPLFLLFFVTLFNQQIAEYWFKKWTGISPWWSFLIIGFLLVWGIMEAIYERDRELYLAYKAVHAPPISGRLRVIQNRIGSTKPNLPYGLEVIIQTDIFIEPVALQITCSDRIGSMDYNFAYRPGVTYVDSAGQTFNKEHYRQVVIHRKSPGFLPTEPITVRLYSQQPLKVIEIEEIPWSRDFDIL